MDKIALYKKIVRTLLERCAETEADEQQDLQTYLVADDQHGHYLLMTVGWHDNHRTYFPYLHVDVRNGKIYVEKNMSEIAIAKELEANGVPKTDIVLAFHAPYKRQHTGYATA
jgi:XisI protein